MRNLTVLVSAFILLISATVRANAAARPLSSYDWSVKASPNLATKPPPKTSVRKFMEEIDSDEGENNEQTRICSFRFVDLDHGANLTLLVTRYDGGHGGCGAVYVVDRTAANFQQHLLDVGLWGLDDVNKVLRDLNGKFVLIDDQEFADYRGEARCSASWPKIYRWDGSNYANLSAEPRFRPFYENEIKSIQRGVAKENPACTRASMAKIERLLGAAADTGMADAISWAKSSDPLWRYFAVGVLSDIGTAQTKNYLRTLAGDTEKEVASYATSAFAFGHFPRKKPEPDVLPQTDESGELPRDMGFLAGPWQLILPPMKGSEVDLKAGDGEWSEMYGFDSQEQCEYGIQYVRRVYGNGGPNYLHGKCIPAPTH